MSGAGEAEEVGKMQKKDEEWSKLAKQIGASVFFGVSSIMIITTNKTVLTTFK